MFDLLGSCPTPVCRAQPGATCKAMGMSCSPLIPGDGVLSTKRCPKGILPPKSTRAGKRGVDNVGTEIADFL